jgi:hypothetical protein
MRKSPPSNDGGDVSHLAEKGQVEAIRLGIVHGRMVIPDIEVKRMIVQK